MAILSLDEAAAALGLTKDDLKDLARAGTIRSFRAGNTLTFKSEDIEAHKASMAQGTPELDDSFLLAEAPPEGEHPHTVSDTDLGSSFSLLPDDMDKVGPQSGDQGATTEMLSPEQAARMAAELKVPVDSPFELSNEPTFRVSGDEPAPGDSSAVSGDGSSALFELSDDSSSEFDVGSSSEISIEPGVDADASFGLAPGDAAPASDGSASFAIEPGDSSSVFELDGSSQVEEASDSAFDLAMGDVSGHDSSLTLEDGSGSEIMALDDSVADVSGISDDIVLEDGSGSEVVPVEEEGDINAGTLATPSRSSKATQLMTDDLEEELEVSDDLEESEAPAGRVVAAAQPWGVLPVLFLTPAFLVMTLLVFLTFEMLLSSIGFFRGNRVSTVLLKPMMDLVDKDAAKLLN